MRRKDFVICSGDLDALEACPGRGVYVSARKRKPTFAQWYGIFVHRFLQYCNDKGHEAAVEWVKTKNMPGVVNTCLRIDPEGLLYGQAEVGWAHDPVYDVSRRVPHSLFDTIKPEREQFGRADLLVEHGVDRPTIVDYKLGDGGNYGRPANSSQLLGLAASYRAEVGEYKPLDVCYAFVKSTGEILWITQEVDWTDLRRYLDRTRLVHQRVLEDRTRADQGIEPEFARNDHCGWCNLKTSCPAWK